MRDTPVPGNGPDIHPDATDLAPYPDMCWIPRGSFRMGSDRHGLDEAPAHRVVVDGFWMDRGPVTNARFARFVRDTGHVTFAELDPVGDGCPRIRAGRLHEGSMVFADDAAAGPDAVAEPGWRYQKGACWYRPWGYGSSLRGLEEHPVVHVTYGDAEAFAEWEGKTLPTEAEWEFAARGGLEGADFPWGDPFMPGGRLMANAWPGRPGSALGSPFAPPGTSAVGAFPANGYGLLDVVGNVWEWTSDWYRPGHDVGSRRTERVRWNPRGPRSEDSFDLGDDGVLAPRKVIKGGSYLSAPGPAVHCRPAARMPEPIDRSSGHVGFRCIVRRALPDLPAKRARPGAD